MPFVENGKRSTLRNVAALYIVGTPIGNLKDITLRALEVLKDVDIIAAEDTRTTRKLLSAYEIRKRLISCNASRERESAQIIITHLNEGQSVAYTSDAGTPGLSDPGKTLSKAVRKAGYPVIPIPGPSALTSIVSVASPSGKNVLFEGFLSPKAGRRRSRLTELRDTGFPFVIFESPFRVLKLMKDLVDICPDRRIFLGREMTKLYEEFLEGRPSDVYEILEGRDVQKGEFTLLVDGKKKN